MDIRSLGELYHDFAVLGVQNWQLPGIFAPNQKSKMHILRAYIQYAIAKCKTRADDPVRFVDLFCADGYYAMVARRFGATHALGIDDDRDGYLGSAGRIAAALSIDGVEFRKDDVNHIDSYEPAEIVANIGGLYHVDNPIEILQKSHRLAKRFLIVQSAVSMANDQPDYFESPAPGWDWGCRFNRVSFDNAIRDLGFHVIDSHFNELEGNDRPEDRGSVYYLIEK